MSEGGRRLPPMNVSTALALRLSSLLLRDPPAGRPDTVAGVVEWFGAMQAQDMASGLWSLGRAAARLHRRRRHRRAGAPGGAPHLADARHRAPRPARRRPLDARPDGRAGAGRRGETARQPSASTDQTADRAVEVLGAALAGGKRLTRAQCLAALTDAGLRRSPGSGATTCSGTPASGASPCIAPNVGKEQSFVLLDEWAPKPHRPEREEALGIIALRYFRSHGPATRKDFARWTGLTMTDVKAGVAAAGEALTTVRVDGTEMLRRRRARATRPRRRADDWLALPGFDEYLLGYKDRSMMARRGPPGDDRPGRQRGLPGHDRPRRPGGRRPGSGRWARRR